MPILWSTIEDAIRTWVVTALAVVAWAPSTVYVVGDQRKNGGNVYRVTVAGTSAAAGGPTGTSSSAVVDGTVSWLYVRADLGTEAVIFADQNAAAPPGHYVVVRLGDLIRSGQDFLAQKYSAGAPAGQEVEFTAKGPREFTASLQAFSNATGGDASPRALLDRVQLALGLPSVREALNNAKLGVLDEGEVRNLSAVTEGTADFEGRALLEVLFMLTQTATEKVGYIATVQLVDLTGNNTIDI